MTRLVKLEKWGAQNGSHEQYSIDGVVRQHEYYRCLSVTNQYKEKMLLWKLHGAANPFISLLEVFKLYALPTVNIASRQLVRYLVKCWKALKGKKTMADFKLQFYYGKFTKPQQGKIIENEQINKMIETMQTLGDNQLELFAQQYDSQTLRQNRLLVEDCRYFIPRIDRNLRDLVVLSQQEKMEKLQMTCSWFRSLWNAQLLYDRKGKSVYISTSLKIDSNKTDKSSRMMTLYDVLQLNQKNNSPKIIISDQTIDKFATNLLDQLEKFEECNKEQWSYTLDIDTVLIETSRSYDQLILGSNCHLDIMQPFLKALGLTNQINTVESLVVFHSKPKPFSVSMNFTQTLKEDFKIQQPEELSQIELGLRWMLLTDYMFESNLQSNGKSLLQTKCQKKKIIETLIGVDVGFSFHPSIKMVINLIKLQNPEIQSPEDLLRKLTIQNIILAYKDDQGNTQNPFYQSRYALIKNSIDLRVKLYFGKESMKQFLEKNKSIKSLDSNGKYITLYLLAHFAMIETERQFLQLWLGQTVQIHQEKDPLYTAIVKFIKITPKIEAQVQKIDISLAKWDTDSGIRERMERIFEYCKNLKGRLFGSSCQKLTSQDQQQRLKQLTIIATQIKDHILYIFGLFRNDFEREVDSEIKLNSKSFSSYLNGRKNLCFMSMFTNLDHYNYSDMYCLQRVIRSFKQSSNQATRRDIKQELDKIQNGLTQSFTKGKLINNDTHTILNQHQIILQ